MAIRLDFVCNLITDEWAKILEYIPENANIDAVPMSKAIKTLTKVQYVMNNRISEEDAFEEEEEKEVKKEENQPIQPPPVQPQTENSNIKILSFDSSSSDNNEKSEKEEGTKPSSEKRNRFISEELREALFDTPSCGLFDDSVDSSE